LQRGSRRSRSRSNNKESKVLWQDEEIENQRVVVAAPRNQRQGLNRPPRFGGDDRERPAAASRQAPMGRESLSDALQDARGHSNQQTPYVNRDQEHPSVLEGKEEMGRGELDSSLAARRTTGGRKSIWGERMAK